MSHRRAAPDLISYCINMDCSIKATASASILVPLRALLKTVAGDAMTHT